MSEDNRGLRFDRRLMRRRGWVDPEELHRYLDSLPDAADKIQPAEEREDREEPPRGEEGGPGASSPGA